jgi:hypothetical protein
MDANEIVKALTPENICRGVLYEPRILFDVVSFDGTQQFQTGNPDVFRNTERYPLRITHVLAGMLNVVADGQSPIGGDERIVQRYGLRLRGHDTYYMNPNYPLLPLWNNVISAASDIVTQATSVWELPKPLYMGRRDVMECEVQLLTQPKNVAGQNTDETVAVAFHAIGLVSKEPKILTGQLVISDTLAHTIPTDFYRNDGLEPLLITKVVVNDAPNVSQTNPVGNIRNVRLRIRLNGNGTNQWWTRGPVVGSPNDRCPEPVWGITVGRSVVHEVPGGGWLWGSGEGISIELQSAQSTRVDQVIIAMAGYIEIT